MKGSCSIPEFYNDQSVFITGATGFMGKVLVEKLLRSCPGIDRVYLLLRPTTGKSAACRLNELVKNEVYAYCSLINLNRKLSKYWMNSGGKAVLVIDEKSV